MRKSHEINIYVILTHPYIKWGIWYALHSIKESKWYWIQNVDIHIDDCRMIMKMEMMKYIKNNPLTGYTKSS